MVKYVYCLRKRADISSETFYHYWLEQHAPLVRRFAEALRAKKYIQSHTIAPEMNNAMAQGRGLAPIRARISE